MKIRDSGMPHEDVWSSFFNPVETLQRLGFQLEHENVLDMGCGYGTFAIAAAQLTTGLVHAIDVEAAMVEATALNAQRHGLRNVNPIQRDFVADSSGLPSESVGYAMLFNILHAEDPESLLREAFRTLRVGGAVAVMHWIYSEQTPRGPSLSIRPRPEQCMDWLSAVGFNSTSSIVDLPPFHFGLFAIRSR